jgi:cell division protein FtsN
MGPYNTKEEAERMKDKMSSTGIETSLVRVQR